MSTGASLSSCCASCIRLPPWGDCRIASLAWGMSVRLTTGIPHTPFQNSIARSRSRTLMQYCARMETTAHFPPCWPPVGVRAILHHRTSGNARVAESANTARVPRGNTMAERYLIVSSDCHAGLPCEEYRPYLDTKYLDAFDGFLAERHASREEALKFNYDYIMHWEGDNEEGLRGAFDPEQRDKE